MVTAMEDGGVSAAKAYLDSLYAAGGITLDEYNAGLTALGEDIIEPIIAVNPLMEGGRVNRDPGAGTAFTEQTNYDSFGILPEVYNPTTPITTTQTLPNVDNPNRVDIEPLITEMGGTYSDFTS